MSYSGVMEDRNDLELEYTEAERTAARAQFLHIEYSEAELAAARTQTLELPEVDQPKPEASGSDTP